MPPRKEPKEQVVYAASKRKAPPFKPQRPSQAPRVPTTESESSKSAPKRKPAAPAHKRPAPSNAVEDSEDEDDKAHREGEDKESSSELEDDPLAAQPRKPSKLFKPPAAAAKRPITREASPMDISSSDEALAQSRSRSAVPDRPPSPTQTSRSAVPQPLLIRLLHENFAASNTKIDKHAIQVLERYFEVFVQETIERAKLQKREDAAKVGEEEAEDTRWLELEDLEKVAAGMMLDF